jgi:hypothetical protein
VTVGIQRRHTRTTRESMSDVDAHRFSSPEVDPLRHRTHMSMKRPHFIEGAGHRRFLQDFEYIGQRTAFGLQALSFGRHRNPWNRSNVTRPTKGVGMTRSAFPVSACVLIAGVLFAGVQSAAAQSTGTIQGTVTDQQGAAVPGATVTVRHTQTGVERSLVTDSGGAYLAPSLQPGAYRIEVKLQGFRDEARDVEVDVARTIAVDFKLGVGAVTEQVNVTAVAPVIEMTTTSVGTVVPERVVQDIPLNGRHFVDLGLLSPGAVTPPQNGFLTAPLRGQGSFSFNTAGNREDTVNFMINGINLNDPVQNQITFQPSINTVSEFKVDNSTFSAEYGRNSGAIVNIATRSGANAFHGEAFEFFRDDKFDSRNYFNQPPVAKSPFQRHQYGFNLGGPIVRDRTFFFGTYEGTRQRQGLDINGGVLSDAQRASVTDPVSRNLLPLIPTANASPRAARPHSSARPPRRSTSISSLAMYGRRSPRPTRCTSTMRGSATSASNRRCSSIPCRISATRDTRTGRFLR